MLADHFHLESLETFTTSLVNVGFRPMEGSNLSRWTGPIHPAFAPLTDATVMDIFINPGWPLQPPAIVVQGLNTNHSTRDGLVCMWQDGEVSLEDWTTVEGLFSRIEQWCDAAQLGWENDHLAYDAFLNFDQKRKMALVATVDLPAMNPHGASWGDCHGVVQPSPPRMHIVTGRSQSGSHLRGLWFHAGQLKGPPPRDISEVPLHLPRRQRRALAESLSERRRPEYFAPSGGVDLILFCWEHHRRTDLLVMVCQGTGEGVEAIAVLPGPNDEESLILRAGPDASKLRPVRATVFGAGALGGHVAVLLAECGIGFLDVVDPDLLLPGNVVRHVAGHRHVGAPKVRAVQEVVRDHVPWAEVSCFREGPHSPKEIGERISNADIVVDTTGNEALVKSLAMLMKESGQPLVSGALYRGGYIGRVQRQALATDTPIHQRDDLARYPVIPAGTDGDDFALPQVGCSAPVNNAPPSAVTACAALITQAAIDVLTARFEFPDEVIDVYRGIPEPLFEHVGRYWPSREWS